MIKRLRACEKARPFYLLARSFVPRSGSKKTRGMFVALPSLAVAIIIGLHLTDMRLIVSVSMYLISLNAKCSCPTLYTLEETRFKFKITANYLNL